MRLDAAHGADTNQSVNGDRGPLLGGIALAGWEQAFARSPLGMVVVVDGRITRVNQAIVELLGRSEAELIGTEARDLAGAVLMREEVASTAGAYQEGERRLHLEGPLRRRDGDTRWVAIDVVILDAVDARVTAVATVTELTDLHRARAELATSQRRFHRLLTNVGDTLWLTDEVGRVQSFTGAVSGLQGYSPDYWTGLVPTELIHPDDLSAFQAAWASVVARPEQELSTEVRVRRADGVWEDVAVSAVNLLDDPDVAAVVLTTRLVTALRQVQRLAVHQADVLELIVRGASLTAVAQACVSFVEADANLGVASIYLLEGDRLELAAGGAPDALVRYLRQPLRHQDRSLCDAGMTSGQATILVELTPSTVGPELYAIAEAAGIESSWSQPILSTDDSRAVGSRSTIYPDAHEPTDQERRAAEAACSLMAIALERADSEAQLAHQALHDVLTGLPNRALLVDRMEQALARRSRTGAPYALLFCDIDRFKVVNDSLGHSVGDQLLVAFTGRFGTVVDAADTVARFGGDEFVVLMEEVGDRGPSVLAERLAEALHEPFTLAPGRDVYLTASIGVAFATDHTTSDTWLRDADAAMYRAKDRGRNRLAHFDDEMRDAALVRLQVENDLRRAVDRDELVVHFQPVVDLVTGRIAGAEALVRWQHPERGLIAPVDFIAVAEDIGVIDEIGRHVLDRSVAAMAALLPPSAVTHFQLGVNVSARQLAWPGLEALVADTCGRHGWPTTSLLLEITESTLFDEVEAPVALLSRIHALGVELAIDDFGTGYSSLTRLGRMPVSQVKIDQSFVGALDHPGDVLAPIVAAVVAIAGALGLRTTAEGVETQAQLDLLRQLRCHQAQGFFFSEPLPVERFATLLAADPRW